ncbi:relaxase/mobilization nuclease domain-containing protein [Crocosphaera chwakensis]|uniref:Mobilization protein BmgA n=1 Tax=Crocosphaera chwakensis CCY0110 TaxID=391612 RepID=A3IXC4_9CHRO|nr:relaxase/mobilization nuclease domain-containing protein [Crocosphaera chwakensis]EAZ88867.1 mobilization protein BmgA [Crocosphaera chwakensis CCY0110]
MIGKNFKGSDFNRCLNYVLRKEEAKIIGGTVTSTEPSSLTREFHFYTQINDRVKNPLFHGILSNPQSLDEETWCQIAQKYLKLMGFTQNPYVLVRHRDRPHDHIHIIAGRVRANGSCVSDSFDYYRNKQAVRQLEKQFKLSTPKFKYTESIPSVEELPLINYIKSTVNELCQQPNLSLLELLRSLKAYDIRVSFHKTKNNKIRGISYHHDNKRLTGTQLGKTYTWPGLVERRNLCYGSEQQSALEELALSRDVKLLLNEQQSSIIDFIDESIEQSTVIVNSTQKRISRSRRR